MCLKTLKQLIAIARFSALEHLGTPAVLLLTLTAIIGTMLLPLFQFQRFSEDGRLARDCGLATTFLFGIFLICGCMASLHRTLKNGTAAIALTKPLSRGVWFCGHLGGTILTLFWFLLTMGAATLTAEACSPRYHTSGSYADLHSLFCALLFPIAALVFGALNHRLRGCRFTLTAALSLPLLLWITPLFPKQLHWGSLSLLITIALFLIQVLALAGMFALVSPPGLMVCLTFFFTGATLILAHGAAYLPLDALAYGGTVSARIILLLLPQSIAGFLLFTWMGIQLLSRREAV